MSLGHGGRVVARRTTHTTFVTERGADASELVVQADPADLLTPERLLMIAVLEDAFHVWSGAVRSLEAQSAAARARERRWIESNDIEWPFSFVNVCHVLDIDVDALRSRLLALEPRTGERVPQARRHVVRAMSHHIRERRPRKGGKPGNARQTRLATRGFGGTANA